MEVGEWIGSNDVRTGLVSPLAWISFSIAINRVIFPMSKIHEDITCSLAPKGVFLWDALDEDKQTKINQIMVHQRN